MNKTISILMTQGLDCNGNLITYVALDYAYRKFSEVNQFIKFGIIVKPLANFKIKYRLPIRWFYETDNMYRNRVENIIHQHLEVYNINQWASH